MNEQRFRFTLSNTTMGSLVISEPDGWKEATSKFDRDKEFHSLIEFYDQPLTFYGSPSAKYDGGYDYVQYVKYTQGPDADIVLLIEISDDGGASFETLVSDVLDLASSTEIDFFTMQVGLSRDDLWNKFINQKGTAVDVKSATGLYGGSRIVLDSNILNLPSQKVRQSYSGQQQDTLVFSSVASSDFIQIDMDQDNLSEIGTKFNLGSAINPELPTWLFNADLAGAYTFNARIEASWIHYDLSGSPCPTTVTRVIEQSATKIDFFIQKNDESPIALATANFTDGFGNQSTVYSCSQSFTLAKDDHIRIYGDPVSTIQNLWIYGAFDNGGTTTYTINLLPDCTPADTTEFIELLAPSGEPIPMTLQVSADTIIQDTTAESYKVHELAQSILDRIIDDDDMLFSPYLGDTNTQRITYGSNGCAAKLAVLRGLHLKTYSFADKPLAMSFDEFWAGLNPTHNLGLGYEIVDGRQVIFIGHKSEFYDASSTSVDLDFVNLINASIYEDQIYKNIKIGFEKWESENTSGVDDPQTKHEYAVQLSKIGNDITLYSKFIAASIAIEKTRRQSLEKTKDWRLDNDAFLIALSVDDDTIPELDDYWTAVTNLLNSDTRYNKILTPARSFLRWRTFFNGCLQFYTALKYKFQTGEGNVTMTSDLDEGVNTCDGDLFPGSLAENQDIDITTDKIFGIDVWEFEHPLSWTQYKAIRNNRKKAIGISRTNSGHQKFFIITMSWNPVTPKAKFKCVKADSVPEATTTTTTTTTAAPTTTTTTTTTTTIAPTTTTTTTSGVILCDGALTNDGTEEWRVFWSGGATTDIGYVGPSDSHGSGGHPLTNSVVLMEAKKQSSSGLATSPVTIEFQKNGITFNTQTFGVGDDVSDVSYSMTGVMGGDELTVLITESF